MPIFKSTSISSSWLVSHKHVQITNHHKGGANSILSFVSLLGKDPSADSHTEVTHFIWNKESSIKGSCTPGEPSVEFEERLKLFLALDRPRSDAPHQVDR